MATDDRPVEERDRSRERIVLAGIAENPIAAQMMQEQLQQAGIRCMLRNRDPLSVNTGGGAALPWSVDVYVLEGDAAAASAILGGSIAGPPLPAPSVAEGREPPGRARHGRPWWRRLLRS